MKIKSFCLIISLLLISFCFVSCNPSKNSEEIKEGVEDMYTGESKDDIEEAHTKGTEESDNLHVLEDIEEIQTEDMEEGEYLHVLGLYGRYKENTSEKYHDYYDLFSSENSLQNMKSFFSDVANRYSYYDFMDQFLAFEDYYDGDNKFVYGYGFLSDYAISRIVNQNVELESGNNYMYTQMATAHMGRDICLYYNDYIIEGRNFSDDDFNRYSPDDTINVILGYDYIDLYNIGDVLESFSLHQINISLRVIGFYKPNTSIYVFNRSLNLDTHIVLPFYDILYDPVDKLDEEYQKVYYSQKIAALMIKIPFLNADNQNSLFQEHKNIIDDMASKYNLLYTLGYDFVEIKFD